MFLMLCSLQKFEFWVIIITEVYNAEVLQVYLIKSSGCCWTYNLCVWLHLKNFILWHSSPKCTNSYAWIVFILFVLCSVCRS